MSTFSFSSILLLDLLLIATDGFLSTSSLSGDASGLHALAVDSMFPSSACSSSSLNKAVGGRSMLPVIHRDGPCYRRSFDERRDHAQIFRLDNERVAFIQSKLSGVDQTLSSGKVSLPAKSGAGLGAGNYVVNISLGTPKKGLVVIFDTGSSFTWTQCQPCATTCYSQADPIFDPSQSSSYRNVSCSSTTCTQIASGTSVMPSCSGSTCYYGVIYGDGSYTYGYLATETLTLSQTDVINNFKFGCGENNQGLFGSTDGLMGLGRDRISIVEQTASKYGRKFSYCLPATSSSVGYLNLGINGVSFAAFTPMLTPSYPGFYGIEVVTISVSGNQLPISSTIFSRAGTIIDSGTVVTRLPRTAYRALRTAFRNGMTTYPMVPQDPDSIFDTCYDLCQSTNVFIPTVAFIFGGGVTVNLAPINILYPISRSVFCLAFAGNNDDTSLGIYGNIQQQKFEVIYDILGSRIGFAPNQC